MLILCMLFNKNLIIDNLFMNHATYKEIFTIISFCINDEEL